MASLFLLGLVGALAPLSSIDHDSSVHAHVAARAAIRIWALRLRSRRCDGVLLMRIRHLRAIDAWDASSEAIPSVLQAASCKVCKRAKRRMHSDCTLDLVFAR